MSATFASRTADPAETRARRAIRREVRRMDRAFMADKPVPIPRVSPYLLAATGRGPEANDLLHDMVVASTNTAFMDARDALLNDVLAWR